MKRRIRLTESDLHRIVKESINRMLNEEFNDDSYLYRGNEENEEWEEAGINPWDFHLTPDEDIAQFHFSKIGYTLYFDDEEFGEVWYDQASRCYRGVSDDDIFDGCKRGFEGANLDGIIEDICDKVASAKLYGNDDEDENY